MNTNNNASATAIEYLKSIDSPTLSNAIEKLQIRPRAGGFTPLEIRCLFPELGRLCGYAVTAQVETVTQMHSTEERTFLELLKAVEVRPSPPSSPFRKSADTAITRPIAARSWPRRSRAWAPLDW